jgi:hypothetical protein
MAIRYTKWLSNVPNGHTIYQHFPFQNIPKLGFLVRKYLATL